MRIGISTSVVQRGKTGVGQYLFALVKALRKFAHEHQFVLFVLESDRDLFRFAQDYCEIVPVPEKFRAPVPDIVWHQTVLPTLVRTLHLDVMHVPSYRRMLWSRACPLVATIHDLAPFHLSDKYDWKRMFYGRVVARRLAYRQDQIIAISENTARDIVRFFGVDRSRIHVIHNGLDHDRFNPGHKQDAKASVAGKHGIAAPFFLYLARLEHPAKNHVRLIEAFERFKTETKSDWHLVFGGTDWHGAEVIHQRIKSSPCASQIRSLGFVPQDQLANLYRAADAFVYPSLFEGFGMPPVEAMACGCPVICSDRGSLAEVVGDAARIVDPENIEALKQELATVAQDVRLRNELRLAGIARAQHFHWNRTATQTFAVYERAIIRRAGNLASCSRNSSQPNENVRLPGSPSHTHVARCD